MHRVPRVHALIAGCLLALTVVVVGACSSAQTGSQGQWTLGPTLAPSSAAPSGSAPAGSAAPPASGNPAAGSPPAVPSVGPATSSAPQPS